MKPVNCKKTRIDLAAHTRIGDRHGADYGLAEPADRPGRCKLVDLGGVDPGIDRPAHQSHGQGVAGATVFRHERDRSQDRDGWLANRDDMDVRPQDPQEIDHVVGIVVEAERTLFQRDQTGVDPIGDVDVMIRQKRLDGAPQQGREMAGQRRHQQDLGILPCRVTLEMTQYAKIFSQCNRVFDGDLFAVDHRVLDTELRPFIAADRSFQQLIGGGNRPSRSHMCEWEAWVGEDLVSGLCHEAQGFERIEMPVVERIEHCFPRNRCQEQGMLGCSPLFYFAVQNVTVGLTNRNSKFAKANICAATRHWRRLVPSCLRVPEFGFQRCLRSPSASFSGLMP